MFLSLQERTAHIILGAKKIRTLNASLKKQVHIRVVLLKYIDCVLKEDDIDQSMGQSRTVNKHVTTVNFIQ